MRVSRIARPYALYDSSVSAQPFETIGETISPIDFAEIVDVNLKQAVEISQVNILKVLMSLGRIYRKV